MLALSSWLLAAAVCATGETVLLEFTADGCVHCRNMQPVIQRLQAEGYPVRQIDVARSRLWAEHYRIRGVPCFVMLAGGRVVDRVEGYTSYERLLQMFAAAGVRPPGGANDQVRAQSPDSARSPRPSSTEPAAQPPRPRSPAAGGSSAPPVRPAALVRTPDQPLGAQQRAMRATVRLKVEDPTGYSFGTGTIIDTHGDEALVITCGHIFRDSRGRGPISVDLYVDAVPRTVPGQLVTFDADSSDVGLVVIRPGVPVTPVPVAPSGYRLTPGAEVFSIGCNNGRPPTLARSRITAVNRYLGPPNVEVAGMPVNGRSGGGLFSADGMLIGICNAADDQDDEGIYAALGVIHEKLAEIGQQRIFQPAAQRESRPEAALASHTAPAAAGGTQATVPTESVAAVGDVEIICVVRAKNNPQAAAETFVLSQPSRQLLQQLRREAAGRQPSLSPSPRVAAGAGPGTGGQRAVAPVAGGPILRAQSADR